MSLAPADEERTVCILNPLGLHARPASEFVKLASRFRCEIRVRKEGRDERTGRDDTVDREDAEKVVEVNGKSIMGMMMLAAECGSEITIRALGEDAELAVEELAALVERRFGEE